MCMTAQLDCELVSGLRWVDFYFDWGLYGWPIFYLIGHYHSLCALFAWDKHAISGNLLAMFWPQKWIWYLVSYTISVRWGPPRIYWMQTSRNGRIAFIMKHQSFSLLVGLLSTTSIMDSHPALTSTTHKRKLTCCAPVFSLITVRLDDALFRAEKALKTDPTDNRKTVAVVVHMQTTLMSTSVLTSSLWPHKSRWPTQHTGDRQTLCEEIPWSDQPKQPMHPRLSLA